ncbi:leukocyte surface antigen CD53-like isoform X3 [Gallus gallus]|uniref:leukocyte surface antigen CD53-like isoform X3 n=2 Tax=Gallus gallus TaxID=9031 RepID=UPI001AE89183|nr:leukocyte surface antigen CD53-like isoform X3 [Gallus gallus]XP_040547351.1 leukocyte surface antigen CD53-like isoform X3 [Gallus gallus]
MGVSGPSGSGEGQNPFHVCVPAAARPPRAWGWRGPELSPSLCRDERRCLQSPEVPMGVLSCMKYLMFIFNVLVFAGGICLVSVGVWVAVDPAGFQDIVAAKPVLSVGAYLLLAVGIALSLLGFLGCCGALRRSRPLLLVFFILVSLVFVTQLVGAVLFLAHWRQIRPELFLSELRRNYCGDEGAEVFSVAWNTLMVTGLKTSGMAPASRSCTQGRPGRRRAVPGMGSCRQASCWAGSSARRGALATSMSRAASPPSARPCRSTSLSPGCAAWPCWALRPSLCSSPFAFTTTLTEQDAGSSSPGHGHCSRDEPNALETAAGKDTVFLHIPAQLYR